MKKSDRAKINKAFDTLRATVRKICNPDGPSATRDINDPCGDKYADKLAAETAFDAIIDQGQTAANLVMDTTMAYESCIMEHGPQTG